LFACFVGLEIGDGSRDQNLDLVDVDRHRLRIERLVPGGRGELGEPRGDSLIAAKAAERFDVGVVFVPGFYIDQQQSDVAGWE
jgi:hypothetical protein